ncbi:hypothetical protein AAFF_G00358710 [Aldrovandia affinis]|uniref:Uncharacterized protein n=1 Tax=Aldrovandia affinis TaxID=143900 RepID=A0AAD7TA46_9TELE|nr:hypothetical protein AAFF_G00358710 [Aldrovandia affinis]
MTIFLTKKTGSGFKTQFAHSMPVCVQMDSPQMNKIHRISKPTEEIPLNVETPVAWWTACFAHVSTRQMQRQHVFAGELLESSSIRPGKQD